MALSKEDLDAIVQFLDPALPEDELAELLLESSGPLFSAGDVPKIVSHPRIAGLYSEESFLWMLKVSKDCLGEPKMDARALPSVNPGLSRLAFSERIMATMDQPESRFFSSYIYYLHLVQNPAAHSDFGKLMDDSINAAQTCLFLMVFMLKKYFDKSKDAWKTMRLAKKWLQGSSFLTMRNAGCLVPSTEEEWRENIPNMDTQEARMDYAYRYNEFDLSKGVSKSIRMMTDEDAPQHAFDVTWNFSFFEYWCAMISHKIFTGRRMSIWPNGLDELATWYRVVLPEMERLQQLANVFPWWQAPLSRVL